MYSTHSHYLINPTWLDQALIISNDAVDYDDLTTGLQTQHRASHVNVERYRSFVGKNPDKATYFQPVLDRLQVMPSRLDALQPSVLVEGKGDYLIMAYGLWTLGLNGNYAIIPTRGADHFDELVGILLGWGVNFALCCDDDNPGKRAVKDFRESWGMSENRAFTLADLSATLSGKSIEGLLGKEDISYIQTHFNLKKPPSKSHVQLFFSEHLAASSKIVLSKTFEDNVRLFDKKVRLALGVDA